MAKLAGAAPRLIGILALAVPAALGTPAARANDVLSPLDATPAGRWTGLFWPTARYGHAAAYDPFRQRMIVFGGHQGVRRNDVWALSTTGTMGWTPIPTQGAPPSARYTHSVVLDTDQDRLIVFGGDDGDALNDVWALSLAQPPTWFRIVPLGDAPSPRYRHSAIYDPAGKRMIVFGGKRDTALLDDVWALELNGTPHWTRLDPAGTRPTARYRHAAVLDPTRGRMIVFGGDDGRRRGDTWALDLGPAPAWTELAESGPRPSPRRGHAAFHDGARDRVVVFGGDDASDVWALGLGPGAEWQPVNVRGAPPAATGSLAGVLDPRHDRVVLFGGQNDSGLESALTTLSLADRAWSPIPDPRRGPSVVSHTAVYDPVHRRMLVFGGRDPVAGVNSNETWALSLDGPPVWSRLATAGAPPLPRFGHGAIYDPTRQRMIVFGGQGSPTGWMDQSFIDTWALDLSAPTPYWYPMVANDPLLSGYSLAYAFDAKREQAIAISTNYSRYWWVRGLPLATSTYWATVGPPAAPREHMNSAAIHDPVRDRVLVFGGYMSEGWGFSTNEVWALDLQSQVWSVVACDGTPPEPRERHSVVYDPVRDRMLVVGGSYQGACQGDLWELSLAGRPTWRRIGTEGELAKPLQFQSAVIDPVHDRLVVFGGNTCGYHGHGETWVLDLAEPVGVECVCPVEVGVAPGGTVDLRYEVAHPLEGPRAVEWTLSGAHSWQGLLRHGHLVVKPGSRAPVVTRLTVPDTAIPSNELTFTAWLAGGGILARCRHALTDRTTSTQASLVTAEAGAGGARLAWRVATGATVTIERREPTTDWSALAALAPRAGEVAHEDRTVAAGRRYGYRLAWCERERDVRAGEVWLDVPAAGRLALEGVRPNPSDGPLAVAFTLPSRGRARLEVFDLSGRRALAPWERDLDAGFHVAAPARAMLAPGLYVVQLTFGAQRLRARAAVVR